jgi:D-serine deaminase-like pyridoxal phosphate-dependent protein
VDAPGLMPVEQSEEHLVLDAGANHHWKIGDILYAIPVHICPTVALYESVYIAEGQRVIGTWPTIARDRKIEC